MLKIRVKSAGFLAACAVMAATAVPSFAQSVVSEIGSERVMLATSSTTYETAVVGRNTAYVQSGKTVRYHFTPSKDCIVTIYSTSTKDTYGAIYNANGDRIASDDDSGDDHNFKFSAALNANETYTIEVKFYASASGELPFVIQPKDLSATKGWIEADNAYYYIKDGKILSSTWIKEASGWYYIGSNSRMVANKFATISGKEYYFDYNGRMKTGWFELNPNEWYYADPKGAVAKGWAQIGTSWYYFNPSMCSDYIVKDENTLYYLGKDGKMCDKLIASGNGWRKFHNEYYYLENGIILYKTAKTIDSKKYYFNQDGKMCHDDLQVVNNVGEGLSGWVCFASDGHVTTGWHRTKENQWVYSDANGNVVQGLTTIDGYSYYFSPYMNSDNVIVRTTDGERVGLYFDENGHAVKGWAFSSEKGWVYADNNYHLYSDGLYTINGSKYYFDSEYSMVANSIQTIGSVKYYFGPDGKLVDTADFSTDGWKKLKGEYYYVKDGKLVKSDWVTSNGKKYYMNRNGVMAAKCNVRINGNVYYFDSEGNLYTGWHRTSEGKWFYAKADGSATTGLMKLDGYTYYFNSDGEMVSDGLAYCTINSNTGYYGFDKDGHLLNKGWHKFSNGTWSYISSGGMALRSTDELIEIDGKKYYMPYGYAETLTYALVNEVLYSIDVNGVCKEPSIRTGWLDNEFYIINKQPASGWQQVSGATYYFYGGYILTGDQKLKEDGGTKEYNYYFDSNGKLMTGWISKNITIDCNNKTSLVWRYADSKGRLFESGWNKIADTWYYFKNFSVVTGLYTIDGELQLFDNNGKWIRKVTEQTGWLYNGADYYYIKDGSLIKDSIANINGKEYSFDGTGKLRVNYQGAYYYFDSNGSKVRHAWRKNTFNAWYYYSNKGEEQNGFVTIDSKRYYLNDGITTGKVLINGMVNSFDKNGVQQGEPTALKDGWNLVGTKYYYVKAGVIYKGIRTIDGKKFMFNKSDGSLVINGMTTYNGKKYITDKNGIVSDHGWYRHSSSQWLYLNRDDTYASGLKTIGGKTYYFNTYSNYMKTESFLSDDGSVLYDIGKDGVVKVVNASGTGWYTDKQGHKFYQLDGLFVIGPHNIDGKLCYIDQYWGMVEDSVGWITYYKCAYADSNGALHLNGFHDGAYLKNGSLTYGEVTINGKTYFLDPENVSGLILIKNKYYYFDGEGTKISATLKEGWNTFGSDKYYIKNGVPQTGAQFINGSWYYFEDDGRMMRNTFYKSTVYIGANGRPAANIWVEHNGSRYYIDGNGQYVTGVNYINGKKYIFNYYGELL